MRDLLQSNGWEQFQRVLGRQTWRVNGVLVIAMPLPLGLRYLYAPRGSVSLPSSRPSESASERRDLAHDVAHLANETGAIFLRVEQSTPPTPPPSRRGGAALPYLIPPRVMRRLTEPEWTWRVSLEPHEDALLAAMHEKHRYNVRLAQKRDVSVRAADSRQPSAVSDFRSFWRLLQDTARRQHIATHPRSYYEMMLRTLSRAEAPSTKRQASSDMECFLYLAERGGEACAAAIVAYHGDTATYLHGGSSHASRQHMAPHLLHWTAMRDAKRAGMRWYDVGGIEAPHAASSRELGIRSWLGMTRFKQGFGGEAVHHSPTMDFIFRRGWYTLLAVATRVRP